MIIKNNIQINLPALDQDVIFHIDGEDYVGYLTIACWEEQILKIALYGKLSDLADVECYDGADDSCNLKDVEYWRDLAENERKD